MDRQTYYSQEVMRTVDVLQSQQSAMIALGKFADMVLGTGTLIDGLSVVPTGPASLSVLVNPGQIYSLANLEATTWSAQVADTAHQIVKQGISLNQQTFTITPPATGGFSQVFLVEVQYSDLDTGATVLNYFNVSNPASPLSGPGNSGTPQNTTRAGVVSTQIKAGIAAATGTQVAPSADAGWTGLYNITVANGQTTITAGNIVQVAGAPFISSATLSKLTAVPGAVQGGKWSSATDTGALNALVVTLAPAPAALVAMQEIRCRVANTNTGATTLNVNGLGVLPVVRHDQSALSAGDIVAGQVAIFLYDITNNNFQITKTGLSSVPSNWIVAAGTADAITATYSPVIAALVDGQFCQFRATAANATTTPTFAPNGLTAQTITKKGGVALAAGDIPGNLAEVILRYNLANTRWELLNPAPLGKPAAPTRQVLTSGTAATYTTPAGATQLRIRMVGGGGSGGGSKGSNGNNGNTSSFNSIVAAGGSAGSASNTSTGGSFGQGGTGGTGSASLRILGGSGASGQSAVSIGTGGIGGSSAFGGAGGATTSGSNGSNAAANSGSGGGGAGAFDGSDAGGGGAGSGEYVEIIINSPTATYTYTVAATAAAGAATGAAGGTGGSGIIIVEETYF